MTIFSEPSVLMIFSIIVLMTALLGNYIHNQYRFIKIAVLVNEIYLNDGAVPSLLAFRYLVGQLSIAGRRKLSKRILSENFAMIESNDLIKKRKKHLLRIIRFEHKDSAKNLLSMQLSNNPPPFYEHVLSKNLSSLHAYLTTLEINSTAPSMPVIEVVAVAFERFGELKVFVQSWINQTESNWRLKVLHDGFNEEFEKIMQEFQKVCPEQISYFCTTERYNDYGHTLRHMGIDQASSDFILLTNADNYFIPKAMAFINEKFLEENFDIDVLLFNMVHSHEWPGNTSSPSYSFFDVKLERGKVDVSSAIVKTELAKKAGFRDKTHDGDATYFEDIMALSRTDRPLNVLKLPNILFVHN